MSGCGASLTSECCGELTCSCRSKRAEQQPELTFRSRYYEGAVFENIVADKNIEIIRAFLHRLDGFQLPSRKPRDLNTSLIVRYIARALDTVAFLKA